MKDSHIPTERLILVAVSDKEKLNEEESNHIKTCPECFKDWMNFVHESVRIDTPEKID